MKKFGYIILLLLVLGMNVYPVKAYSLEAQTLDVQVKLEGATTYKKVTCGDMQIPYMAPQIVSTVYKLLQIATPIIIIIFGSLDLVKAVMAQKEDDIKKGQQIFVRRLIVGSIVFVAFWVIEMVIGFVAPHNENENMWNCVDCFVTGDCKGLTVENTNNDWQIKENIVVLYLGREKYVYISKC